MRKAQVSMYIILGIAIVAILFTGYGVLNYSKQQRLAAEIEVNREISIESIAIKDMIDKCVQTVTDSGMKIIGQHGFYLTVPPEFQYDTDTAYWMIDTVNVMPDSFLAVQQDLQTYVDMYLPACVDFESYLQQGWSISRFNPVSNVSIYDEDIGVSVNYTITVEKDTFSKESSNSIYIPLIRFRQMYIQMADFMNNQLLRPDFNFNNPLGGYNQNGYTLNSSKIDGNTLKFTVIDGLGKIIDGEKFTLTFAARFAINSLPRTYPAGTVELYSPDRLAVLIFPDGSPAEITIRQYVTGSVDRKQTPNIKVNQNVVKYIDTSFATGFPIYRFSPCDLDFSSSPAALLVYLNEDQKTIPLDYGLINNEPDGWIPYPHEINQGAGTISAWVYGFKCIN